MRNFICFIFCIALTVSVLSQEPLELTQEEASAMHPHKTLVEHLLERAERYIGTPYKYGGTDSLGFDCSGYVQSVFAGIMIDLPHSSGMIADITREVGLDALRKGDLVIFSGRSNKRVGHVGIVCELDSNGTYFIHASTSRGVRIDKLEGHPYFEPRLIGFRSWEW